MKLSLSSALSALFSGVAVFAVSTASAQTQTQTHRTSDYVEQTVAGDTVVTFTGDELYTPPGGAYGDTIRRPPGTVRYGLIRPRLNFVVEMLKSVENL